MNVTVEIEGASLDDRERPNSSKKRQHGAPLHAGSLQGRVGRFYAASFLFADGRLRLTSLHIISIRT